jgi:predicted nucleic acid-binding protein
LDSNILLKLILNESNSKEARTTITNLLRKGHTLCTVDIALPESLNVVWKHTNLLKELDPQEANLAIEDLTRIYDGLTIIATREIKDETIQIAIARNITVYDALYIAAAQKINATLYTADQKLYKTAKTIAKSKVLETKSGKPAN